jgi:hypothetical protein
MIFQITSPFKYLVKLPPAEIHTIRVVKIQNGPYLIYLN